MNDKNIILVVDDRPQNIELLEAYLVPQGYEIITAENGQEALEKLSVCEIDLILLDVMMSGMDGFEVTRKIRQDEKYQLLPIILVTALQEKEDRVKGIEAGCDDFISKPVDKSELLARVRSLIKVKAYNDLLKNYREELESEVAERTEELKKAFELVNDTLVEKNTLLNELYHRTKNNMQVITSLLFLKSSNIKNVEVINDFREMSNRIQVMAMVHEKLIQSKEISKINMKNYVTDLVSLITNTYTIENRPININLEIQPIEMLFDIAIPCGLIINELLSNAIKYAFPDNRQGDIKIALSRQEDNLVELCISDNGIGLPKDFDIRNTNLFGLKIAIFIVEHQLKGTIEFKKNSGLYSKITFEDDLYKKRV